MKVKSIALAAVLMALVVGTANAGTACHDVLRYLKADIEDSLRDLRGSIRPWAAELRSKAVVLRWGPTPPRVLYMASRGGDVLTPEDARAVKLAKADTEFVVWLLNKDMPKSWQLRLGTTSGGRLEQGAITVLHLPHKHWPAILTRNDRVKPWGKGIPVYNKEGEITTAAVLIDYTRFGEDRSRIHVLLHEMLHALDRGDVDRREFPETIMHSDSHQDDHGGHLKNLGKAALRAVYSPAVPVGTRGASLKCDSLGRIEGAR